MNRISRRKHRLASLLLYCFTIIIALSTLQPMVTAEEEATTATQPEKMESREYNILRSFGFIGNLVLNEETKITRGMFAQMVAEMMGMPESGGSGSGRFVDVPAEHEYATAIDFMDDMGIMVGVSSYQFEPDTQITYVQALKTIISALGYHVQAELTYGGYPTGYLTMAASLELVSGMNFSADDILPAGDAVKILYRATDVDIMKQDAINNGLEYNVVEGRTLLTEYHDIYYTKGLMTDNGITALSGDSGVGRRNILVDGIIIEKGDVEAEQYLGYYVEVYYYDDGTVCQLRYVEPYGSRNEVLVLQQDDLETEDAQFNTECVVYNDADGKTREAKISKMADLIYNGKAYAQFGADTLKIEAGEMTLIDNDTDGVFDVVVINEYENCYVLGTDTRNERVYGKYGDSVTLSDYDIAKIYTADGEETTFDTINSGQVLTVMKSLDASTISVYISTQRVNANITQIEDTGKTMKFTTDSGNVYELAENVKKAIAEGKVGAEIPEIGGSYTFALDLYGKVGGMEESTNTGYQYAYLVNMAYDDGVGGDLMMRFFMANNEIFDAYVADKVTINGVSGTKQDLYNDSRIKNEDGVIHQLVRIRLNDLGDLTELEFAVEPTNAYGYDINQFSKDFTSTSAQYKGSSQMVFNGIYTISTNTTIFAVPSEDDFDVDDIEVITPSGLVDGRTYEVTLYDLDASLSASVAVIVTGGASGAYENAIFVVEKVTQSMNEDGEAVKIAKGVSMGAEVSYMESEPGVFPEDLKCGDVLRVGMKGSEVARVVKFASLADKPDVAITSVQGNLVGGEFVTIWGYLYSTSTNALATLDHYVDDPENPGQQTLGLNAHSLNGGNVKVTVYDVEAETVTPGSMKDVVQIDVPDSSGKLEITDDSVMVFLYRRYDYLREIVVVRY